jgi:hypothetical protein
VASLNRGADDAVVIAGAVFRALCDLAAEWPGADDELLRELEVWPVVGGVSLNTLTPELRRHTVTAFSYACERALVGERSAVSGDDAAGGERLILGAEAVHAFLLCDFETERPATTES